MSLLSTVGSIFTKALPWVAAGVGLLSTVKQYQGAKAIEKEGEFNAQVFLDESAAAWRSYEDKAAILRDEQRRENAAARTGYAKSGVALEGTPMTVLSDFVYRQSLDQTALYNTAVAQDKSLKTKGALVQWQAYNQAGALRSQALGNFGASLISTAGRVQYPTPWTKADDTAVVESAKTAPRVTRPNYSRAQANAVPGASGWRPVASR